MKFEDKYIIANGIRMHYLEGGQGEPLVFIHGLFGTSGMYLKAGHLLAAEYRVFIVDLPGVGQSGRLNRHWSFEDYYKSLYGLFRAAGLSRLNLIGHSFGGTIAMELAAKSPELIKNLILVNSLGIRLERPYLAWSKKTLRNVPQRRLSQVGEFFPEFLKNLLMPHFRDLKKLIQIIVATDISESARKIKVPTLLLWGTSDTMLPLDYGYNLKEIITNSRLIEVEGGSHYWLIQEPQRFYNHLHYYLTKNQ